MRVARNIVIERMIDGLNHQSCKLAISRNVDDGMTMCDYLSLALTNAPEALAAPEHPVQASDRSNNSIDYAYVYRGGQRKAFSWSKMCGKTYSSCCSQQPAFGRGKNT